MATILISPQTLASENRTGQIPQSQLYDMTIAVLLGDRILSQTSESCFYADHTWSTMQRLRDTLEYDYNEMWRQLEPYTEAAVATIRREADENVPDLNECQALGFAVGQALYWHTAIMSEVEGIREERRRLLAGQGRYLTPEEKKKIEVPYGDL